MAIMVQDQLQINSFAPLEIASPSLTSLTSPFPSLSASDKSSFDELDGLSPPSPSGV